MTKSAKITEAQDKKKQLKKMRDEMNVRTSNLRESIEQKKKLLEKLNKEKNDKKIWMFEQRGSTY